MNTMVLPESKLSDEEIYRLLEINLEQFLSNDDHYLSSLSNFTSILKYSFEKISWVGFYLYDGNELYLGPFQGKSACTKIAIGRGVCGTSAEKRETIVVNDVMEFPGHIACDSASRSEIVVPLVKDEKLLGVLDLDSTSFNSFNEADKIGLEKLCSILLRKISL